MTSKAMKNINIFLCHERNDFKIEKTTSNPQNNYVVETDESHLFFLLLLHYVFAAFNKVLTTTAEATKK